MIWSPALTWLLAFLALPLYHQSPGLLVSGQYNQNYVLDYTVVGGQRIQSVFWRPDAGSPLQQVAIVSPKVVVLEYNCAYMRDICQNAKNFMLSSRGLAKWQGNVFGYDMDVENRKEDRRRQSCPSWWSRVHPCPETDQYLPMRNDKEWYFKDLEPGTTINEIKSLRDAKGNVIESSNIRYTCDEFPAASWVEGGSSNAAFANDPVQGESQTRCAAFRCGGIGTKAEQNWQGWSHGSLRNELVRLVEEKQAAYPKWLPDWSEDDGGVALFQFRMANREDGVAARVITYSDSSMTSSTVKNTFQAKRDEDMAAAGEEMDFDEYIRMIEALSIDDILRSGNTSVTNIFVNQTEDNLPKSDLLMQPEPLDLNMMKIMTSSDNNTNVFLDSEQQQESSNADDSEASLLSQGRALIARQERNASDSDLSPLLKNASPSDIEKARKIVKDAIAKSSKLNKARLKKPMRNNFGLKPGTVVGGSKIQSRSTNVLADADVAPPLLNITDTIVDAAALVAEADAAHLSGNSATRAVATKGTYWMGQIKRQGKVVWGGDSKYTIFRNVLDYGAKGDGVTDDTKAIKQAMIDGKRCGEKCNGSTLKNAIVYFPPGKYLVSSSIPMPFGTQVIGDANEWPTILASSSFVGLGVLSTDEYTGGNGGAEEYYVNTSNFYRQIRNMRIDITRTDPSQMAAALHYQVAQATSLQNMEIIAKSGGQQGIFAENGSGGVISDITFTGGTYGIYGGSQQFTAQRLTFNGCDTGVALIWDWGWVWKSITMKNVGVGFKLLPQSAGSGNIGSATFLDSSFTNVKTAILSGPANSKPGTGSTGIVVEHVKFQGVGAAVADSTGKTLLAPSPLVGHWALGPIYTPTRSFTMGSTAGDTRRVKTLLDSSGNYFERPKPQYEGRPVGDFIHIKDFGAKGDGVTDDTAAVQAAIHASQNKILFVDAGVYMLTNTVLVPSGTKLVGETWSQFAASGANFKDASNPRVMLKVGNPGDIGSVEMQDLIFTVQGATAGVILVEWNMKASQQGAAALWDCHVRIGGASGSALTPNECPAVAGSANVPKQCKSGSLMIHLTPGSSGYFENMWLWVADHMIDDPKLDDPANDMTQVSVYVARGMLIESTDATWLYGTASEHAVYYQYNFNEASNIFAGLMQTEAPYYQPLPAPPQPFPESVGKLDGDPKFNCTGKPGDFSGCDASWSTIMRGSSNIAIAAAGFYNWFSSYTQGCIDSHTCQKALVLLERNGYGIRIQNLVTIGAKYMIVQDGSGILATDNLNVNTHPDWSQITVFDVTGTGIDEHDVLWADPVIWDMDQPQFTCSPPCKVKIPPWTGATSTVNYPLMTVSTGSWTSTITVPPITITEVLFNEVTLAASTNKARRGQIDKRQGFTPFWPVPQPTPHWPPVVYRGPDGKSTTATLTVSFPKPPSNIGPSAKPPPTGSWPKKAIQPVVAASWEDEYPFTNECSFDDWECRFNPWKFGPWTPDDGADDNSYDYTECPKPKKTSSSTRTTATSTSKLPGPSPMANSNTCYGGGRKAKHSELDDAIKSFCAAYSKPKILEGPWTRRELLNIPTKAFSPLAVIMELEISSGCQWNYNADECSRFLHVNVDSCNCGGVDGKQGGWGMNNCLVWRVDPNDNWQGLASGWF